MQSRRRNPGYSGAGSWPSFMLLGLVGTATATSSCGGPTDVQRGGEDTATTVEGLATAFGSTDARYTTPWASPGTVNVCFIPPNNADGSPGTLNPTLLSAAMATFTESWGAATGISFSLNGQCPASVPSNWITVFLETNNGNGDTAGGGIGPRFSATGPFSRDWATIKARIDNRTDVQICVGQRAGAYKRQVAHEIGHALGFYHEMERSDGTSDLDPNCRSGTNTFGHITNYDSASIMRWSYCTDSARTEDQLLSPLDQVGGEMMYPRSYTGHPVACSSGCVLTGTGAVVRSTGAITIDWVRRGAPLAPVWHVNSQTFQPANGLLAATSLPSGTSSVTMNYTDAHSRAHSGGGTVVKSDSAYTAVLSANAML